MCYKQIPVQIIVNGAWKLYSKAKLQKKKRQFSLLSAMFTFTVLIICSAVVLDALKGMSKPIHLPKLVYFRMLFS